MFDIARRALALILLLLASSATAWAQAYPERPLRLVVGFPPGGSGDFLARKDHAMYESVVKASGAKVE